jgi:hypothetical protein
MQQMDMDAGATEGSAGSKEALLFVNKKKQKTFNCLGMWQKRRRSPPFARIFRLLSFKKVTAHFL